MKSLEHAIDSAGAATATHGDVILVMVLLAELLGHRVCRGKNGSDFKSCELSTEKERKNKRKGEIRGRGRLCCMNVVAVDVGAQRGSCVAGAFCMASGCWED